MKALSIRNLSDEALKAMAATNHRSMLSGKQSWSPAPVWRRHGRGGYAWRGANWAIRSMMSGKIAQDDWVIDTSY